MFTRRILIVLGVVLAGWSGRTPLEAQAITGRVVDATRSGPVAFALVQLSNANGVVLASVASDPDGRFRVDVPAAGGLFSLTVETLFHHPVTRDSLSVPSSEVLTIPDIVLELAPIGLEELTVDVRRSRLTPGREWTRRNQLHGKGTFLSGAVIALSDNPSVASYIADQTRLWVRLDANARPVLLNPAGSMSRCVKVLINRWKIERTAFRSIDEIPQDEIAAIEIYENERDLPPGYYFDGEPGCGVINVWLWNSW